MAHLCNRISWVCCWRERWTRKTRHSINIIDRLIDSIDCMVWQIKSSWSWWLIRYRIGPIRVGLSIAIIWLRLRACSLIRHCVKNWIRGLENAWRVVPSCKIYTSHYIYARIRIMTTRIVALIVWWAISIIDLWVLIGGISCSLGNI